MHGEQAHVWLVSNCNKSKGVLLMKKILLSTTALATASVLGAVATPASAQTLEERIRTLEESMLMGTQDSPFSLDVWGWLNTGFFLVNADNGAGNDYAATDVKWGSGEVRFTATSLLDNGMTVGAETQLNVINGSGTIDETYIWVEGGFGKTTIGSENDASYLMHYSAPWTVGLNGVDSPNYRHTATTAVRTSTQTHLSNDSNKITYFTPRFSGFQFGVSYTPEYAGNDPVANGWGVRDRGLDGSGMHDIIGVGANFTRDLGDFAVSASAGWEAASTKVRQDDPVNWHVGASVSAQGFTLGGSYFTAEGFTGLRGAWEFDDCLSTVGQNTLASRTRMGDHDDDPATPDQPIIDPYTGGNGECVTPATVDLSDQLEQNAWAIGAQYGAGPWTLGVAYFDAKGKNYNDEVLVAGVDGTLGTEDDQVRTRGVREPENSVIQFGGSYNLAPGVTLAADVNFYEDKDGRGSTIESTGGGLMMGISF